jgi:hypothetical protein
LASLTWALGAKSGFRVLSHGPLGSQGTQVLPHPKRDCFVSMTPSLQPQSCEGLLGLSPALAPSQDLARKALPRPHPAAAPKALSSASPAGPPSIGTVGGAGASPAQHTIPLSLQLPPRPPHTHVLLVTSSPAPSRGSVGKDTPFQVSCSASVTSVDRLLGGLASTVKGGEREQGGSLPPTPQARDGFC